MVDDLKPAYEMMLAAMEVRPSIALLVLVELSFNLSSVGEEIVVIHANQ
jgi:hypothetical protein